MIPILGAIALLGLSPWMHPGGVDRPAPMAIAQAPVPTAHDLFLLGLQAFQTHQYPVALTHWQAALAGYEAAGDQQPAALTLNALAVVTIALGQYSDAIAYSQASLALAEQLANRELQGQVLSNLATAYQGAGRYGEAVTTYEQALALMRALDNLPGEAQVLSSLGNVYASLGDYPSAIATQQASLALAQQLGSPALEATARLNLGGLYAEQGDYPAAIAQYESAIALALQTEQPETAAHALNNLGGAYQQLGQIQQAIAQYTRSLALAEQTENALLQARVLSNLGVAYENLQDPEAALTAHRQSVAIARTVDDPRLLASALNNLAHTLLGTGALTAAESALMESTDLLSRLRQGLTDGDNVTVFDTQIYTYNLLMQVRVAQGNTEGALEASEQGRARAFVELLAGDEGIAPPTIADIIEVAQTLNATLVEYAIVPDDDFTVQGRQRGQAGQLYIWVVSPTGEVAFRQVDLTTADLSLEGMVQESRSALGALGRTRGLGIQAVDTPQPSARSQLQRIYTVLIEPIAPLLPTDPRDRVVFIPQESLFYLPWAALQDAEGRYLIEKHTLLTAPAIQLLALTLAEEAKAEAVVPLVAGNPTMPTVALTPGAPPETLSPLPGAEAEAAAIARILQTQPILGSAATKAALVPQMEQSSVIHLATHGLLDYVDIRDRVPVPGAIALAPSEGDSGLLTAREIAQLSLHADLVVLSACDTGLGEVTGDGVVGLSRSLIAAGARSTVVSLWAVPDAPTADLMVAFYENLRQGQDKAQALRQAMLQTLEIYPNPLAWAAFVLIGDPSPL